MSGWRKEYDDPVGNPTLSEVKENFTSKIFDVTSTHKNGVKENLIDLISSKEGGRAGGREGGTLRDMGVGGSTACNVQLISFNDL